ncbi:conserved hypothetical protein [Neisseria gonorrhoeae DGI2]|uniref:Uncharacterized protein n=1 Tax=Neisseria gonorrhoeae (strain NCCP11945) TaxID=521006 RepID=B4RQE6_NEIG2|nr:Hypothetical protein NGK_1843 [Neisseria gonorrhoeae NCCP11945]EFE04724.1 conserved hypothetical protein [Neisseria gonorrhoeae DGI2]
MKIIYPNPLSGIRIFRCTFIRKTFQAQVACNFKACNSEVLDEE